MRFVQSLDLGPFDTNEALWDAVRAAKDPFIASIAVDELFRYDATTIDILKLDDGSIWLKTVVDEGSRQEMPDGTPTVMIVHYLPFQDEAALRATLHGGFIPTRASYAAAGPVVFSKFSYIKAETGTSDFRYTQQTVRADQISDDDLPGIELLPGTAMIYGPFTDVYGTEATRQIGAPLTPGDEDEVLAEHDGPRNWIVRRPKHIDSLQLVVCVGDGAEGYAQHRLSFACAEQEMRDTLAAGCAPTMDTYRLATSKRLETIGPRDAEAPFVIIEPIDIESSNFSRPSFESRAQHDAEWPDFAFRKAT